MSRSITTLFMLTSVDGKISTGITNDLDFDKDLPKIEGLREGLNQYYENLNRSYLCTGKVQAKLGVNSRELTNKSVVSYVLIDNHNLNENGIKYFCRLSKKFVLITTNPNHIAFNIKENNFHIILQHELNLEKALEILKSQFNCERITIQSGGTINGLLLREKLIDYVDIVIAPTLIGGKRVPTLIDGDAITSENELNKLGVLELQSCEVLKHSYIRLRYKVIK